MLRTLNTILHSPGTLRFMCVLWVISFLTLFVFVERSFFINVFTGDFPLWLFLKILPTIFSEFATSDITMLLHYLTISLLLALYLTILRYMFVTMHFISLRSIGISVAGVFGITLGVACLSCGALAGLLLISALGALSLPLTLLHNSTLFLLAGEGLLVLGIILILATVRNLTNH
ncbi:MAG: hypothetical protein WDZ93_03885 [Candidatus Paceibacterota bacterium]